MTKDKVCFSSIIKRSELKLKQNYQDKLSDELFTEIHYHSWLSGYLSRTHAVAALERKVERLERENELLQKKCAFKERLIENQSKRIEQVRQVKRLLSSK